MKRARFAVIAAAVFAVATVAFAQAKPDFSGTWTPDQPAAAPGGGGGRMGMGGPMTVKQPPDTLTIERSMGDNKISTVYKLDGTETVNKQMGRGGEVEVKTTAKWDGNKLVLSSTRPGQDGTPRTTAQTWSLDGGNLTIEGQGRGGETTKTVYKKTT